MYNTILALIFALNDRPEYNIGLVLFTVAAVMIPTHIIIKLFKI